MPRVVLTFDPEHTFFSVMEARDDIAYDPEYQVIMDMKSSHYRNILKNFTRFNNDQKTLLKFFIEAQQAGRIIRER